MAQPIITLAYTDANGVAQEKSMVELGYTDPVRNRRSKAFGTFTVRKMGGDPASKCDIPFENNVVVYLGRTGLPGNYKGGTRIFYGRRIKYHGTARGDGRSTDLTLADALYDFQNTCFMHYWAGKDAKGNTTFQYYPDINLFQDIKNNVQVFPQKWTYFTADMQLLQIIQFMQNNVGCVIQPGVIDPVWNMPLYPASCITCMEALQIVLRTIPDAVTWIDYTTNDVQGNPLPTLHIRQRANCQRVTLPWKQTDANGRTHLTSDITERPELIPPSVSIYYRQTNNIQPVGTWTAFATDVYPPNANGLARRALNVRIDLRGGVRTYATGQIMSTAFDPTQLAFWKGKKSDLAAPTIVGLALVDKTVNGANHPNGITVVDANDQPVDLTLYQFEFVKGEKSDWMQDNDGNPIDIKECTVTGFFNYESFDPRTVSPQNPSGTRLDKNVQNHPVTTTIKLTNSIPDPAGGFTQYSMLSHLEQPEVPPANLAQNIWQSLQKLQYEGHHVVCEDGVTLDLSPFNVLCLAGPGANADWATMDAVIYEVETDYYHGRTTIQFGPFKDISVREFFDLLMMWRLRRVFDNPNIRNTGQDNAGNGLPMPSETPKQDTNAGSLPPLIFHSEATAPDATGNQFVIFRDPVAQQFGMMNYKGNQQDLTVPNLLLDLNALPKTDTVGGQQVVPKMRIARMSWTDPNDCETSYHAYFAMTQVFDGA